MKSWWLPLLVAALLAAPPAWADDEPAGPDPVAEALAVQAAQIRDEYCSDLGGKDTTVAAQSLITVGEVWARVSAHWEQSQKVYLLYWRGALGQCLNQDERALEDLERFVSHSRDTALWAGLVSDARRRIHRIERKSDKLKRRARRRSQQFEKAKPRVPKARQPVQKPRPAPPSRQGSGIAVGAALAGGSAALAAGAMVAWQESQRIAENEIYPKENGYSESELQAFLGQGRTQATVSHVLAGVAIASGLGAAVTFVLVAGRDKKEKSASVRAPVLLPIEAGAVFSWGLRW
jgi:hypothetical protein